MNHIFFPYMNQTCSSHIFPSIATENSSYSIYMLHIFPQFLQLHLAQFQKLHCFVVSRAARKHLGQGHLDRMHLHVQLLWPAKPSGTGKWNRKGHSKIMNIIKTNKKHHINSNIDKDTCIYIYVRIYTYIYNLIHIYIHIYLIYIYTYIYMLFSNITYVQCFWWGKLIDFYHATRWMHYSHQGIFL